MCQLTFAGWVNKTSITKIAVKKVFNRIEKVEIPNSNDIKLLLLVYHLKKRSESIPKFIIADA